MGEKIIYAHPPEVVHGCHSTEGVLGVRKLWVEEELTHHLGVVIHGGAGHPKGYWGQNNGQRSLHVSQ